MGTAVNVALTLAALEGAEALQHVSLNELSTANNSTAFMVRSVRFTVGPSRAFRAHRVEVLGDVCPASTRSCGLRGPTPSKGDFPGRLRAGRSEARTGANSDTSLKLPEARLRQLNTTLSSGSP